MNKSSLPRMEGKYPSLAVLIHQQQSGCGVGHVGKHIGPVCGKADGVTLQQTEILPFCAEAYGAGELVAWQMQPGTDSSGS